MEFLNVLGETVSDIGNKIIDMLPKSPFYFLDVTPEIKEVLEFLNWFIPIDIMIAITEGWLISILIYYGFQFILRWIKFIE